ncbi:hypothetical protein V5799_011495 [Amblyomma americanum]|uniref:Uncharacterized protein n=1 Tax=Amblyomma americanum TaxID=6943 RepID=A0AAQ4EHQ5_AMBAM
MEDGMYSEFMTDCKRAKTAKRKKTAILRCRDYGLDGPVNYKREHVMLYLPFRKEIDILDGNAFERLFDENRERTMQMKIRYNSGVTTAELLACCQQLNAAAAPDQQQEQEAVPTLLDTNDNGDLAPETTASGVIVAGGDVSCR